MTGGPSRPAVVVHGGAGAWVPGSGRLTDAQRACDDAAAAGLARLAAGASALDAVEFAVRALEDCPLLNAGRGSIPNRDGVVEMDALIMDGETLQLGAVAAVRRVRNPVSLARLVMERTPHTLLVADGAGRFADDAGVPRCSDADLIVPRTGPTEAAADTVGAVAVDGRGRLAAATSTGGIRDKMPGRVGDSPLVGCGAYADGVAAVSATGDGEALMKLVISKRVDDALGAAVRLRCRAYSPRRSLRRTGRTDRARPPWRRRHRLEHGGDAARDRGPLSR